MQIYLVTNLINGKKYLGKDVRNRKYYLGSGTDIDFETGEVILED